jgi:hypothetical protein
MAYLIIAAEYFAVAAPAFLVVSGVGILVSEHLEKKAK